MTPTLNVLFLCTANSARSILAEATANHLANAQGKFHAYSAGSRPAGQVHPLVLDLLEEQRIPTVGLRSKDWYEFATADAPRMAFVFTVCDQAAAEPCPIWPGQPVAAHWGVPDPAAAGGSDDERRKAFKDAFLVLKRRIELFASLPIEKLSALALQERLDDIGRQPAPPHQSPRVESDSAGA
jgi:protein-tyrosine-phosphatase